LKYAKSNDTFIIFSIFSALVAHKGVHKIQQKQKQTKRAAQVMRHK